jgi:hypothetical protein
MRVQAACRVTVALAVVTLFVNDHFLKRAYPGFVTGKLSDVAGMIFFPLLLAVLVRSVAPASLRDDRAHDRLLLVGCVLTAVVFALTKTMPFANELYRFTWGALQWPYRALVALASGRGLPRVARVVLVRDPSDVLAVPFVVIAYLAGARRVSALPLRAGLPMRCGLTAST